MNQKPLYSKPTLNTRLCICYTSGTSGTPKGVVLNQGNALASTVYCTCVISKEKNGKAPVDISGFVMFPLSHIMERESVYIGLALATNMYFPFSDDIKSNFKFISKVKPNAFAGVPRIWNRLALGLKTRLDPIQNPSMMNKLINKAIDYKLSQYNKLGKAHSAKHILYDQILYRISKLVGFERTTCLFSGSAPMSPETISYLRAAFNVHDFLNGYGLTETFGGVQMSIANELMVDNLGPPGLTSEIRLLDIPDMGYEWDKNRKGELMIRGPQVSPGYSDRQQTEENFDKEGWFKTGDVVEIDELGKMRIIDRRKNFFKLSHGEFIIPEKIENTYLTYNVDLINQIWCYGDSSKDFLIAVIGLDYELLKNFLDQNFEIIQTFIQKDISKRDFDLNDRQRSRQLFDNMEFKTLILKKMNYKINSLQGFERIKNIYIEFEPLDQENDTLTPTLKVKRHKAKKVFTNEIKKLYDEGPLNYKEKL